MKHSPITRAAGAMISFLVIAGWLVATNHCVVAGLLPTAPAPSAEHEHCPGHKAPAGEQKSGDCGDTSCCKSLSAPVALAKNLAGYDLGIFVAIAYPAKECDALLGQHDAPISELDTGPPCADSFAEAVLQRSLLAHAPPVA